MTSRRCRPCGARPSRRSSTRRRLGTRLSFETAAKRLSADVMTFTVGSSSVGKGEGLRDTVQTIAAMGVDALIVRHAAAGVPWRITDWIDASVINAGDGRHEHPTQALLDAFTIRRHVGDSLDGLEVVIVGDIRHSRVARSTTKALTALGAHVTLVGPPTLLPESLDGWSARATCDLDAALAGADVVYLLRIQLERQDAVRFPSLREYTSRYGLTEERAARLRAGAVDHAPGAHESRRGDRGRGRRRTGVGDHRAGHQRRRDPDGGAVPPARFGGSGCLIRSSSAVARCSTRPANVAPTLWSWTAASPRSARTGAATRNSMRPVVWWHPGWSTSTPTCANPATRSPRRSRPGRGPARSAGSPRSWRCRTPLRPTMT